MVHNFKHGGVKDEIMIYTIGDWNCDSIDSNHFFFRFKKIVYASVRNSIFVYITMKFQLDISCYDDIIIDNH